MTASLLIQRQAPIIGFVYVADPRVVRGSMCHDLMLRRPPASQLRLPFCGCDPRVSVWPSSRRCTANTSWMSLALTTRPHSLDRVEQAIARRTGHQRPGHHVAYGQRPGVGAGCRDRQHDVAAGSDVVRNELAFGCFVHHRRADWRLRINSAAARVTPTCRCAPRFAYRCRQPTSPRPPHEKRTTSSRRLSAKLVVIEFAVWRLEIPLFGDQQKAGQTINRSDGNPGALVDFVRLPADAGECSVVTGDFARVWCLRFGARVWVLNALDISCHLRLLGKIQTSQEERHHVDVHQPQYRQICRAQHARWCQQPVRERRLDKLGESLLPSASTSAM